MCLEVQKLSSLLDRASVIDGNIGLWLGLRTVDLSSLIFAPVRLYSRAFRGFFTFSGSALRGDPDS